MGGRGSTAALLVLGWILGLGGPVLAQKPKPQLCPVGRFLVAPASEPLLQGVSPALDAVGFDQQGHVTLDGCGPATRAKVKATKRFTILTAHWDTCGTYTTVTLVVKIASPACDVLSGKIRAKKLKAKVFPATRSTCGDSRVDTNGGEQCDAGSSCGAGVCTASCLCAGSTTTTTACVDADGDGWTTCDGDCCDSALDCATPALVNPGAFEVPGNLVDDDCDGVVDNPPSACDAALASNSSAPTDYAKALDLCQTTTESPPSLAQKKWGVISANLLLADGTGAPATNSRSIRRGFGPNVHPSSGTSLAILSTGNAAASADTNPPFATFQPGLDAGTSSAAPVDWLAANGGVFPNAPGCPPAIGTTANDPVMLKLRVRVPTNAKSFSVQTFFYSAEYPEFVCSPYNDVFLVLLDSTFVPAMGEAANPADKNLAFFKPPLGPSYPVGVNLAFGNTGLFQQCVNGTTGCGAGSTPGATTTCVSTSQLAGTGFEVMDPGNCNGNSLVGGGTGWLAVSGNVKPGETIEVRFVIWDTGDHTFDSLVLLDHWAWSLTTTTPGTD